ncbi:MAG: alpha/beta fold hydrolase [Salinivenus sp.]
MHLVRTSLAGLGVLALVAACSSSPASLNPGEHHVVVDGVRLAYTVAGPTSSTPPVVFLHGGPGYNSHSFAVQAGPLLESSHRMIYLDQRGAGRSERPWTNDYSLARLVEDLEALRLHWDQPTLVLMGHSFGGALALEYAARHPERVARMILVGPLSDAPSSVDGWAQHVESWYPSDWAAADAPGRSAHDRTMEAIGRAGGQPVFDRLQFPNDRLRVQQDSIDTAGGLRNTGEQSQALFEQGLGSYRFAAHERLTMPVLVIGGPHDYSIGLHSMETLAASLPNGTLHLYDGAGHFPYLDQPERFSNDVTMFLSER